MATTICVRLHLPIDTTQQPPTQPEDFLNPDPDFHDNERDYETQWPAEVVVDGSIRTISQVSCCLTWLAAAIRLSASDGKLCYSDATFQDRTVLQLVLPGYDDHNSMYFKISTTPCQPLTSEERKMCWTPLFPASIIADGYPIPKRPDSVPGLEIPFEMLVSISKSSVPVRLSKGVILQGSSTALVPTLMVRSHSEHKDCLLWHFIVQEGGISAITVLRDNDNVEALEDSDIRRLREFRSFVGWTTPANVCLGTEGHGSLRFTQSSAKAYKVERKFKARLEQVNFAVQLKLPLVNVTVGSTIAPTYEQPRMRRPEFQSGMGNVSDEALLDFLWNKPVFFYDSQDRRGWLVTRGSAILFILHALAKRGVILDVNLKFPNKIPNGGEAARDAIQDSLTLPLWKDSQNDKDVTLLEGIRRLHLVLDSVTSESEDKEVMPKSTEKALYGWDFQIMLDPTCKTPTLRVMDLKATSGIWPRLSQRYPVFFVDGLGEVIEPIRLDQLCPRWKTVPPEHDYLTASLHALNEICLIMTQEHRGDFEWLNSSIRWKSSVVFSSCRCTDLIRCITHLQKLEHDDNKQEFKSWKAGKRTEQSISLPLDGAVVFGQLPPDGKPVFGRLRSLFAKRPLNIPPPYPDSPPAPATYFPNNSLPNQVPPRQAIALMPNLSTNSFASSATTNSAPPALPLSPGTVTPETPHTPLPTLVSMTPAGTVPLVADSVVSHSEPNRIIEALTAAPQDRVFYLGVFLLISVWVLIAVLYQHQREMGQVRSVRYDLFNL